MSETLCYLITFIHSYEPEDEGGYFLTLEEALESYNDILKDINSYEGIGELSLSRLYKKGNKVEVERIKEMPPEVLIKNPHVKKLYEALVFIRDNPNYGTHHDGSSEMKAKQVLKEWQGD